MDDTQQIFNSSWTIPKLIGSGTWSGSVGPYTAPTLVVTWASLGLTFVPEAIINWKKTASGVWYMDGGADTSQDSITAIFKSDGLYVGTGFSTFNANIQYYVFMEPMLLL